MATMPDRPEPGSTGWSFSSKTLQRSPSMNLAVWTSESLVMTELPMPRASEDEKPSLSMAWGMCSSMPFLTSWLHMTPEETMARMLDTS